MIGETLENHAEGGSPESDCRFSDETILYDATDSYNRIRNDRVGAALLR